MATSLFVHLFFGLLHWLGGFWYIITTGVIKGIPFGLIQLKRETILLVFTAYLSLNSYVLFTLNLWNRGDHLEQRGICHIKAKYLEGLSPMIMLKVD